MGRLNSNLCSGGVGRPAIKVTGSVHDLVVGIWYKSMVNRLGTCNVFYLSFNSSSSINRIITSASFSVHSSCVADLWVENLNQDLNLRPLAYHANALLIQPQRPPSMRNATFLPS